MCVCAYECMYVCVYMKIVPNVCMNDIYYIKYMNVRMCV